MKKSARKVLSLCMAALMLLSILAGCSGGGDTAADADVNGALDPNDPTTFDLWIDFTWWGYNANWTGAIPEEITAETGVSLNATVAVDAQQLGTMIANDALPDLIFTSEYIDELSSSYVCYPLNELIEEYDVDWEITDAQRANALLSSQEADEGNFFFVYNFFHTDEEYEEAFNDTTTSATVGTLAYRHDLWEEMGSPSMSTPEEFLDVLRLAKETYPDIIPMYFSSLDGYYDYPIRTWFGITGTDSDLQSYMDTGDEIVHVSRQEGYKDYLKYMNTIYREGLAYTDNVAWDSSMRPEQSFAQTTVYNNSFESERARAVQADPNAELWTLANPNEDAPYNEEMLGWGGVFISKNCENPEKAIRFLAYLYSDEGARLTQWGREGIDWEYDENGNPVWSEEWIAAQNDGDDLKELYNTGFYLGGSRINEAIQFWSNRVDYLDELGDFPTIKKNFTNQWWVAAAIPRPGTDLRIAYDNMLDYIGTAEDQVTLSTTDEEFEQNYQTMIDTLESMGLAEVEAYMTEQAAQYRP